MNLVKSGVLDDFDLNIENINEINAKKYYICIY